MADSGGKPPHLGWCHGHCTRWRGPDLGMTGGGQLMIAADSVPASCNSVLGPLGGKMGQQAECMALGTAVGSPPANVNNRAGTTHPSSCGSCGWMAEHRKTALGSTTSTWHSWPSMAARTGYWPQPMPFSLEWLCLCPTPSTSWVGSPYQPCRRPWLPRCVPRGYRGPRRLAPVPECKIPPSP